GVRDVLAGPREDAAGEGVPCWHLVEPVVTLVVDLLPRQPPVEGAVCSAAGRADEGVCAEGEDGAAEVPVGAEHPPSGEPVGEVEAVGAVGGGGPERAVVGEGEVLGLDGAVTDALPGEPLPRQREVLREGEGRRPRPGREGQGEGDAVERPTGHPLHPHRSAPRRAAEAAGRRRSERRGHGVMDRVRGFREREDMCAKMEPSCQNSADVSMRCKPASLRKPKAQEHECPSPFARTSELRARSSVLRARIVVLFARGFALRARMIGQKARSSEKKAPLPEKKARMVALGARSVEQTARAEEPGAWPGAAPRRLSHISTPAPRRFLRNPSPPPTVHRPSLPSPAPCSPSTKPSATSSPSARAARSRPSSTPTAACTSSSSGGPGRARGRSWPSSSWGGWRGGWG